MSSVFRPAQSLGGKEARVPMVRMTGHWMEQAGFPKGARVRAVVTRGQIVLTVAPDSFSEISR